MFFGRDGGRIGGTYVKVIYKEYTDNTFTNVKSPDPGHLGILGKAFQIWQKHISARLSPLPSLSLSSVSSSSSNIFVLSVQVQSWGQRKETLSEWRSWTRLIEITASSLTACTMTNSPREAAMRTVRRQPQILISQPRNCDIIVRYQDSNWVITRVSGLE